MAKRVILGVLLSMVVMLMVGTAAFAAPNSDKAPCVAECTPNGDCGAGTNNVPFVAHGGWDLGGPGASEHAHLTLAEVIAALP